MSGTISADRDGEGVGDPARVFDDFYAELRAQAERHFRAERPGHTLQPTAIVNEAFMRLAGRGYNDTVHVKAIAARAMRQVLVDHARKRGAGKRGGGARRVTLCEAITPGASAEVGIEDLGEALDQLARHSERQARVVELRFFAGLTIEETSEVLGVSHATVSSDWRFARAWLEHELER